MPRLPSPLVTVAWACALVLANAATAQTAPDAGRLLQETRPTPSPGPAAAPPRLLEAPVRPTVSMPDGVTVTPTAFRVSGAVSFPVDALVALTQPWVGRRLDLRGLNEAASAITRHYQAAGHFLSYAYLPAQRVADGVIEIAVLEGRLDAVQVANTQDVRLREQVVQAHVAPLENRTPVLQPEVERALLLLNDIPGVTARAAFAPGANPGGADMVVTVAEEEPLELRLDASNHGSRSTGVVRLGATLLLRNLFGYGDATTARLLLSERGGLVSGSLGTLLPLGGDGWKVGASVSRLKYELADAFSSLGAQGTAQTWGLKAQYPLLRRLAANLAFEAAYENRRLRDDIVVIGDARPKRNDVASGSFTFDLRDGLFGRGSTAGVVVVSAGHLRLLSDAMRNLDAFGPASGNGVGLRTDGSYQKLTASLARQQALWGPLAGYARYTGQQSRRNLDSSEKLALGGPGAVRAYASGEALVDEGGILTGELRWLHDYVGGNVVVSLFYDRATGRLNVQPLAGAGSNEADLVGYGLGLQWNAGDFGLATSFAWRSKVRPTAEGGDPRPRVWVQVFYTP